MIDVAVAVLAALTLIVMGELCRWAWRVHDHNQEVQRVETRPR